MFLKRHGGGLNQPKEPAGKRKRAVSVRIPKHMEEFVFAAEDAGYRKTEVILRLMEIAIDASKKLGDDWWEVERLAGLEGETLGTILGDLAKAGLEATKAGFEATKKKR